MKVAANVLRLAAHAACCELGADKSLKLSGKRYICKRSWPALRRAVLCCAALAFPEYSCPVPGNAALGVLRVHAPVIRCRLLSAEGQWSEIWGALLLLERTDSRLMLIGTQQGATPMMCVCMCVCALNSTLTERPLICAYMDTCMHTHYYCAPSHAMFQLTASLSGSVKHSREPVTSSSQSSHSLLCDGVSVCVCVYFPRPKRREYSSVCA